jgi:hypothetical protein
MISTDGVTVRKTTQHHKPQRLHLVFGGELSSLDSHEYRDLNHLDIVGVFPDYDTAFSAWKAAAQRSVDNAMMRYVIVHLHKLLEPDGAEHHASASGNEARSKP